MIEWFTSAQAVHLRFDQLAARARAAQEAAYAAAECVGWCSICCRDTKLRLIRQPGPWTNLRERLQCDCGMNGRMRMVAAAFEEWPPSPRFLMMERVSPFFAKMSERFPFAEGSEFFGVDVSPGAMRAINGLPVKHENLLELSLADRSLRYLFHGDVLEHVSDMKRALAECYRVLEVGGTLLFSCPITNLQEHIVRAKLVNDTIEHLLPPVYHGNPLDERGSLVFNEPGWQLLDDVRAAGFQSVEVGLLLDPRQGILRDGNPYEDFNMWPVVFRAVRLA